MKVKFEWGDDIIDSRNIISRYEELKEEYDALVDAVAEAEEELRDYHKEVDESPDAELDPEKVKELQEDIEEAQEYLDEFNQSFDRDELDTLQEVVDQGEDSPDWNSGETLIHENYFETWIDELIKDSYEIPEGLDSGKWPYNHYSFDLTGAAEEAKSDYFEIEVDGNLYYIRA